MLTRPDNLRYTIDHCLLNATEEEATCRSPRACGPLDDAITRDLESPREDQYAYCDVDGGIMLGEQVDNCFTCVRAGGDQSYLSNCTHFPLFLLKRMLD